MMTSTSDIAVTANTDTAAAHEIQVGEEDERSHTSGCENCSVTTAATVPVTTANGAADRSDSTCFSSARFSISSSAASAMDEEEEYPKTQQEELNEILEAFYEVISDEQIRGFQQYIEEIERQSRASKAVQVPEKAPDFELIDQDGELVRLSDAYQKGPVILVFYRGKWCPHCNAVVINLQKILPQIQAKGASIMAISPMLPDGTAVLATKRTLQFPVLSDVGNTVARQFRLTFSVPTEFRSLLLSFGEDIPQFNGDDSWEIPLPATYIINQEGNIVWCFLDDDTNYRAEPADILAAIPTKAPETSNNECEENDVDVNDSPTGTRSTKSLENPCHSHVIHRRTAKAPPRWPMARSSSPPEEQSSIVRDNVSQHSLYSDAGSMDDFDSTTTSSSKRRSSSMASSVKSIVTRVFGRKKQEPMEFLGSYL